MLYIFLIISLLFISAIALRQFARLPVCAICASIILTWITLLVLYKTGHFHDPVLLSLLMGQSIAGVFYLLQKRVPSQLRIFTLPFFLSLTAVFYLLITAHIVLPAFILLTVLWVAAWLVFASRNDPGKKYFAKAVMNCCKGEK